MAVRLDTLRTRVRSMLKDTNPSQYAVATYALDSTISQNLKRLAGSLGQPLAWDTSFVTLVAGTEDYTVSDAFDYHSIALFRTRSDGRLVERVSPELLERYRQGNDSAGGGPVMCCVLEAKAAAGTNRSLTVRVWPTPGEADYLDALTAEFPVAVSADTDGIPLSDLGATALEYYVAAEALMAMSDDEVARLKMSKAVVPVWEKRAEAAEYDEFVRAARLRRGRQMNRSSR